MKAVMKEWTTPAKRHGILFDGLYFFSFLFLPLNFLTANFAITDTILGFALLLAILSQIGGAWLKKGFLRQRLEPRVQQNGRIADGFMKLLRFLHFILFTVTVLMALVLWGVYHDESSDLWLAGALIFGGITTAVVHRAGQGRENAVHAPTSNPWLEYVADALLWISVSILTRAYWGPLLELVEPATGLGITGRSIVLLMALSLLFIVFYLPGRYLYFVEDYRSPWTWVRVWIAILPVYRSVLFA